MPLIPIEIPPGMMKNGTPYSARGRWVSGNLVRYHDGAPRPIGGWQARTRAGTTVSLSLVSDEIVRDCIDYKTIAGLSEAVFYSNKKVYRLDSGNQVSDITPAAYPQTLSEITDLTGYGIGPYGREPYGVARSSEGSLSIPVGRVTTDMWGENPLFAVVGDGSIYEYVPGDLQATAIATAPTDIESLVVTNERVVMALRNSPDIREVVWSDREDNTDWTPTASNYAGSQVLQGSGRLVCAKKVLGEVLILSENDAHVARYTGAPFAYGFSLVGVDCGPIWPSSVAAMDRFVMWWGRRNFWLYDGTLRPLPCEVMDFLNSDINKDAVSKIFSTKSADFSEVWWFYQSNSSDGDVDSYVVYDYVENHWHTGRLSRTCGFDRGAFSTAVMVDTDGDLFNHELENVAVDASIYSGPLELENGNRNMAVRYVFMDTQAAGSVSLELLTKQFPTGTEITHGPYTYANPISTTGVLGRQVRMGFTGLTNNWEIGTIRFDVQAVGGGFR